MKALDLVDKYVTYLTPEHSLFIASTLIMTGVHLFFRKEWTAGLKGVNGLWEGPEIVLYICLWLFPPMISASFFLQLKVEAIVWYVFVACLFFGLTGRFGLEWLLAFKSGASQVTSTISTREEKTVTKKEEKVEEKNPENI